MDNIERFNRTAAALFKCLYESFPTPIVRFDSESLCEAAGVPRTADARSMICETGATVKWLADEGFVRYNETNRPSGFTMVVLTHKGLVAMNRVPDAVTPTETVGERLKQLGREASTQTVAHLVQTALTLGVAAVARAGGY
ncbi:hypothetical protein [Opitutus sp. ER46]|uniref:hypothetical protein n=1 Tax=Opitutus sp. ER46 TaxID=2161864 RepID=UPI000D2FE627|nr:hypothetical protein [Opitutus sp. ER46]PTX95733.1 hypothetical protein DB354_10000 [Opitutus sp. ER46]